jgi:hypothetical protein
MASNNKEIGQRKIKPEVELLVEIERSEDRGKGYVYQARPEVAMEVDKSSAEETKLAQNPLKELWKAIKTRVPKFSKVTRTGPGRYYLEPENEETRKALVQSGLDVRQSGVRNPRIVVHGVGEEVDNADDPRLMEEQNESPGKLSVGWQKNVSLIPRKNVRITSVGRDLEFEVTP